MRYAVVIEKGEQSYGADVPDLPGVISVGETEEEAIANIRHAIGLHLDGLRQAGDQSLNPGRTSLLLMQRDMRLAQGCTRTLNPETRNAEPNPEK